MADGRYFENRYIFISQPRIVLMLTKFGTKTQILTQPRKRDKRKSEINTKRANHSVAR